MFLGLHCLGWLWLGLACRLFGSLVLCSLWRSLWTFTLSGFFWVSLPVCGSWVVNATRHFGTTVYLRAAQ